MIPKVGTGFGNNGGASMQMNWPWPPPRRKDIGAILLVVVFIGVLVFGIAFSNHLAVNFGFGPEWRCVDVGSRAGGPNPVCIKDVPAKPPSSN
jgi:hypothetical protein